MKPSINLTLIRNAISAGVGVLAGWILHWLKVRRAFFEAKTAKLEFAEKQRNENRRVLCTAILAVARETKLRTEQGKNLVFSGEHLAACCDASAMEVEEALASLQSQGRAERKLSGSWVIYA